MLRRTLAVVAALAVYGALANAQTVDEILAKHIEARGGMAKLKAVQTMRMTGKMIMGQGMEAPFVVETKRPNSYRFDFTLQGLTGTQAYDGKTAWMSMPFGGKKDAEPMPEEQAKALVEESDFDGMLVDAARKGHTIELGGREQVEGADTYKLKVTLKDGGVRYVFLDAESFLQIKQEAKHTIRGTEIEGETLLSDYKEVGGLMFPHSVEAGMKGMPQRRKMSVEKIELDVQLDASRFAMPAPADTTKAAAAKPAEIAKPAAPKPAAAAKPAKGKSDKSKP